MFSSKRPTAYYQKPTRGAEGLRICVQAVVSDVSTFLAAAAEDAVTCDGLLHMALHLDAVTRRSKELPRLHNLISRNI